jgi:hypothetical protein
MATAAHIVLGWDNAGSKLASLLSAALHDIGALAFCGKAFPQGLIRGKLVKNW